MLLRLLSETEKDRENVDQEKPISLFQSDAQFSSDTSTERRKISTKPLLFFIELDQTPYLINRKINTACLYISHILDEAQEKNQKAFFSSMDFSKTTK